MQTEEKARNLDYCACSRYDINHCGHNYDGTYPNCTKKPESEVRAEEKRKQLLNDFGNKLMLDLQFGNCKKHSNGIAEYVEKYMATNPGKAL